MKKNLKREVSACNPGPKVTKFCTGPNMTSEKVYGCSHVIVLYCTKRNCSKIEQQLKVEIEVGREAP